MSDSVWIIVVSTMDVGVQPVKAVKGTQHKAQRVAEESERPLWVLGSAEVVE